MGECEKEKAETALTREEIARLWVRQCDMLWQGTIREMVTNPGRDPLARLDTMVPGEEPGTALWRDIDYTNLDRSGWLVSTHYSRLLSILVGEGKERLARDADYREGVLRGFRYWLIRDFINPNWWHNEIGTPLHIADLTLLLFPYLTEAERTKALEIVARGSLAEKTRIADWTGANLLWGMQTTVRHGLLIGDGALLTVAAKRVGEELKYASEGIQPDGSFCQHGHRWYSGGYGGNFTFDMAQLIYLFADSPLAFSEEKIGLFLLHVLDGQRHMAFRGYLDYNAVGREFSRPNALKKGELLGGVRLLAELDSLPRIGEVRDFLRELTGGAPGFTATRYYPEISYLTRTDGTFVGVKCHNAGQLDAETCNSEGVLCYNMSYGTRTCLMARGDEYFNIDPVWDFAHIPGTVARLETDGDLYAHRDNWWSLSLPNSETVGVAEGDYGILTEHAEHDGISARVTFFTYAGCMAALGCEINDTTGGKPLSVTLEQAWAREPEIGKDCASNGGFTYRNLEENGALVAAHALRAGDWKRNCLELASEPQSGDVFLAYIPLDGKGSHYAYDAYPRSLHAPGVQILANESAVQAIVVKQAGKAVLLAAFHTGGTLSYAGNDYSGAGGECRIWQLNIGKEQQGD